MRLLPDSIAGRTILVLLVGLTLSHLVSMGVYHNDLLVETGLSGERQVAARVASIKRAIAAVPEADRDHTAHALSGHGLEAHWDPTASVAVTAGSATENAETKERLLQFAPELGTVELLAAHVDDGPPGHEVGSRSLLVASQLPDGSWANFKIAHLSGGTIGSLHLLVSTTLMAIAVVVLSVLSVRVLTAPLRALAKAAERLGVDMTVPPLPETGPREVRQAAYAFNGMQSRIRKLLADRTQTLAAISHDLRTPITRLRLRAELVEDDEQRRKMMADLAEMEAMIASTLAFIRGDADKEEARIVDVAALLETICDDMADAGHAVRFDGERHAPLRCRPLALKRAFTNLIDNAVKYGGTACVSLRKETAQLRVDVDDDGPGIPGNLQEEVFSPFYRVETSRSRETGGTGLGLTVARSIVRAHGGDIDLSNRLTGGLRVTATLPQPVLA